MSRPLSARLAPGLVGVVAAALLVPLASAPATAAPAAPTTDVAPALSAPSAPASRAGTTIRFLTYNIRFGERGLKDVARDIRRTGATIVTLNEVDDRRRSGGPFQARYLARQLNMDFAWDPNARPRPGIVRGNAILSKHPMTNVKRYALPNPGKKEPRGLMKAKITVGDKQVLVYTTHLNPGVGKLKQAQKVRRTIGDPRCASLLGGDLNVKPGSREHRLLTRDLRDLWVQKGQGPGNTSPSRTGRIDYLLFKKMTALSARVTPAGSSDHLGVVGDFKVSTKNSC